MNRISILLLACLFPAQIMAMPPQTESKQLFFRVKYVAADAVYLDSGLEAGLKEGMKLTVKRLLPGEPTMAARVVGEVVVTSLATSSAVCSIESSVLPFQRGDMAFLSQQDAETVHAQNTATGRKYAQVVTFTEGDPLDEELRESVPRPPLPEVNRIRGRIGFEQSTIWDRGSGGGHSLQEGLVLRADMTRIGGTYWNFTGYWRGRINSRNQGLQQQTLTDLLNRTYQIGFQYNNPQSRYAMGIGRLYLPWASSLSTIDGGYFGARLGKKTTVGFFAGSTPDPTAWNYNPDRQIAGTFVNFEGGSFEGLRYTSTTGIALTRVQFRPEREYAFFENALFFKQYISVYNNVEIDRLTLGRFGSLQSGPVLSRNFLTVRFQPFRRIAFDLNQNYFRNIPTFDTRLIGIGLLDRYLFQGLSGGFRLDLPYRVSLYTNLGGSKRDTDARTSLNQMYGVTLNRVWRTGVRADFRFSQFDSSFGKGSYEAISISRDVTDKLRLELQGGKQSLQSPFTQQTDTLWFNGTIDYFIGSHYFLGGGYMIYRGKIQDYDQSFINLGYRF
ncbi:MAG: hypothetical protein U0V70_06700 [Terriglobia bacterium]